LFALCLGTKNGFVKFCEAHEQRFRPNVHDFRVIRADAVEGDTYTLTLADSLQNGLQEKRFAGNETGYAVSRSPPPLSQLFHGTASFLNMWFWNIPIRLSFHVWPSLVDGDEHGIATRVPAMM
jgi:hypothetical protein